MKVNGNELAKVVTEKEGKKISVNIAQVREVLRLAAHELFAHHTGGEILTYLERIACSKRGR